MSATLILYGDRERQKAHEWIDKAPALSRLHFKGPARSTDQNAKLWACLTEVSEQVLWHGQRLLPDDWKVLFTASLRQELRMVPNLDGDGFVLLGMRTSDMSREEMSQLLELVHEFGARHGIMFHEPQESQ